MKKEHIISGDIADVEHHLGELFHVPVGVCIADTHDIVLDVLGYEISDMRRRPNPECRTAFQYLARIAAGGEWQLLRGMMLLKHRAYEANKKPV